MLLSSEQLRRLRSVRSMFKPARRTPLLVCAEMVGRVMEATRMQKRKRLEIQLRRKTPLVPGELTPK